MLVRDAYGEDFHINPNHVVKAYTTKDEEDYAIELSNSDSTMWLDRESYERVVAWMERQTSTWSYTPFKEFGGDAMSEDLKPCPFCGETPDHYEGKPDPFRRYGSIWRIAHDCNTEAGVRIETMYYITKDEAADAWNRRAE